MVHYGFNLGSPAANIAPERTGGRYATRHAGQNPPSIRTRARQPKAGLNRFSFTAARGAPHTANVVTPPLKRNVRAGIHTDSWL